MNATVLHAPNHGPQNVHTNDHKIINEDINKIVETGHNRLSKRKETVDIVSVQEGRLSIFV